MAPETGLAPYCGMPPLPADLWHRWNLDPILLSVLVVLLGIYFIADRSSPHQGHLHQRTRRAFFFAGWSIGGAALISPLCALSVSLFSARVGQHMILALVSAPLVVLGRPGAAFARLFGGATDWRLARRMASICTSAPAAAILFAALLWLWHAPGPYAATFASSPVYWLMHLSLYGGALLVWTVLLDRSAAAVLPVAAVGVFTTLQMTFLGALLTIAGQAMYVPHATTTAAWGLTPLTDQQLGGAIMWVPACTVFLAVTVFSLARALRDTDQADPLHSVNA